MKINCSSAFYQIRHAESRQYQHTNFTSKQFDLNGLKGISNLATSTLKIDANSSAISSILNVPVTKLLQNIDIRNFNIKNPTQYVHIGAEINPLASTGGLGAVLGDFITQYESQQRRLNENVKDKHIFMLPYYNDDNSICSKNGIFIDGKNPQSSPDIKPRVIKENGQRKIISKSERDNYAIYPRPFAQTEIFWANEDGTGGMIPVYLYKIRDNDLQKVYESKGGIKNNAEIYLVKCPLMDKLAREYSHYLQEQYKNKKLSRKEIREKTNDYMKRAYAQFNKACVYLLPILTQRKNNNGYNFNPQNILLNDWHTACIPEYINDYNNNAPQKLRDFYKGSKLGFIIHNLDKEYQGRCKPKTLYDVLSDKEQYKKGKLLTEQQIIDNLKKRNLLTSDGDSAMCKIPVNYSKDGRMTMSAVSPQTALDIQTEDFAYGLSDDLKELYEIGTLKGIVNGINSNLSPSDMETWKFIPEYLKNGEGYTFSTDMPEEKIIEVKFNNKSALINTLINQQEESRDKRIFRNGNGKVYGMLDKKYANEAILRNSPLIFSWGRFVDQKGIYLALDSIKKYLDENPNDNSIFVFGSVLSRASVDFNNNIINSSEDEKSKLLEQQINELLNDKRLKGRFVFLDGDFPVDAICMASDYALFSSKQEPCGIVQLEAMRYGCIPIATGTGGFISTINDNDTMRTGFLTKQPYRIHVDEHSNIEEKRKIAFVPQLEDAIKRGLTSFDKRGAIIKNDISVKTGWNDKRDNGLSPMQELDEFHFGYNKKTFI